MYRLASKMPVLLVILMAARAIWADPAFANTRPHIVIDASTGAIISQHRANDRWFPASLTKLMTAYVTLRAISSGELQAGSPVRISKAATLQPPSKMGYKKGVELRVDTALKIIVIKSANDVSLALAEAVAGTLKDFVSRMNREAKRLGLVNTRFANSNGLHDPRQFTSARDMAVLSARLLGEYPEYSNLFSAVAIKTATRTHYSYNLLLERFPGTTGLKTGFVCASGYNLAASAVRNGQSLIAIVLGAASQTERAVLAAKLLKRGFGKPGKGSAFLRVLEGAPPENMRPVLCTKQARASRYDPPAGNAVIHSPHLFPRKRSNNILEITTGGVDAPPGDAYLAKSPMVSGISGNIAVPKPRPNFDRQSAKKRLIAIGSAHTGKLPLPKPRPQR